MSERDVGDGVEMSERMDKMLEAYEANKFTVEELEAIVEVLEACDPLTAIEQTALAKLRWHIATADSTGDE